MLFYLKLFLTIIVDICVMVCVAGSCLFDKCIGYTSQPVSRRKNRKVRATRQASYKI